MIAPNVPEGFNTTKIKGNTELQFLPGENVMILSDKKDLDSSDKLLYPQNAGSNPEASTASCHASDEAILHVDVQVWFFLGKSPQQSVRVLKPDVNTQEMIG